MNDLDFRLLHALRYLTVDGMTLDPAPDGTPRRCSLGLGVPHWLLYVWTRKPEDGPGFDDAYRVALRGIEADGFAITARLTVWPLHGDLFARRPDGRDVFVSVNNSERLARAYVGRRQGNKLNDCIEAGERWGDDGLKLWRLTPDGARAARDGMSTPEADNPAIEHSDDFTSVRWGEQVYDFTKTQAAAIRKLWTAWERGGLSVSEETLAEAVDSKADRFRLLHTFRAKGETHPAWNTLVVTAGKGSYRLALPKHFGNHQESPNANR